MSYDPSIDPDLDEWLALGEDARLDQVRAYHRRARVKLPNERIHAALHVTVENQLAEPYGPAVETLERLLREGLSRHDAIHAIASVVATRVHEMLQQKKLFDADVYRRE